VTATGEAVSVVDPTSFDDFYLATSGRLLGQLAAMTADRESAADALQDAYAKAWLDWRRVSQLDNPEAWVRTVAWRRAVSGWRRTSVARRAQPLVATPESHSDADVATAVTVRQALARLPMDQRRVLVLFELCDLSVEDVAREVGVPVGTVKSRLARGRAALGELLGVSEEVRHGSGA
jgi:RNA polymerase sigma-70 factor (ECF subfamily)